MWALRARLRRAMQRPAGVVARGSCRVYGLVIATFVVTFVLIELASYGSVMLDDYHHPSPPRSNNNSKGPPSPSPSPRPIRGLSPSQHADLAKTGYACADTGKKLPFNRINDNYCDCGDGTDEPGTSACANGRFWCAGEQHHLASSMVDDGICDCCDGSDESPQRKCPNTCESYHPPTDTDDDEGTYDGGSSSHSDVKSKPHESVGYSFLIIGLWVFILAHLFAILAGLWYLATPRGRDHIL